jgi:hypothetical protein
MLRQSLKFMRWLKHKDIPASHCVSADIFATLIRLDFGKKPLATALVLCGAPSPTSTRP